ncbi:MAG TPA: 3-dehydroquinate synthase [Rhabdochlamydiaceae bacterium]|nr:3-dehydroquinate synthase [Rhabdochlamydiaceae bacterium]
MEHNLHIKVLGNEHTTELSIGAHILQSKRLISQLSKIGCRFALVTDSRVEMLFGRKLAEELTKKGLETILFSFPEGEEHKTRRTKEFLEDQMLEKGFGRDGAIIALGGGVVTDLAGFLAATYCRGIPLISIPTTLLGMVDASIGGKNGVNTSKGKNLIGSFYHPKAIFIDTHMLETLSENELRNGTAEIIKYGLISSPPIFEFLDQLHDRWLAVNQDFFQEIIYLSCLKKKDVIEEDPNETGLRRTLNFGHTVGHALELLECYKIGHGDAIAIGMIVESYISMKMGTLQKEDFEKIFAMFKKYRFPLQISSDITIDNMIETMALDKKSLESVPRFVILKSIGQIEDCAGQYCKKIEPEILKDALKWMCKQFHTAKP